MQPDGQTVEHLPHRMQESEKRNLNRLIFETMPNNVPTGQREVQKKRCFQTTRMLSTIKTPAPAIKAGFFKKEKILPNKAYGSDAANRIMLPVAKQAKTNPAMP